MADIDRSKEDLGRPKEKIQELGTLSVDEFLKVKIKEKTINPFFKFILLGIGCPKPSKSRGGNRDQCGILWSMAEIH